MKKVRFAVCIMALIMIVVSVCGCGGDEGDRFVENIGYEVYSSYWKNGTLYVEGCITNLDRDYHLISLENAVMVAVDSNGLEVADVVMNSNMAANAVLRARSKRPYNFTIRQTNYDISEYADLTRGLQVYFKSFSCEYGECLGNHCGDCHGIGMELSENPFIDNGGGYTSRPDPGSDQESSHGKTCGMCGGTRKCHVCNGKGKFYCEGYQCINGKCSSCKGSGVYNHGTYLSECTVCGGDGYCDICNGSSYRSCYTCGGSGVCKDCK